MIGVTSWVAETESGQTHHWLIFDSVPDLVVQTAPYFHSYIM